MAPPVEEGPAHPVAGQKVDQALAIERRHAERVDHYRAYLAALERENPAVVRSLVVGQLNKTLVDAVDARVPGTPVYDSTDVFASLEPGEAEAVERVRIDSVLSRWAPDDSKRVWLLASGALCVFVGLLPPVSRRAEAGRATRSIPLDEPDAEFDGIEDGDAEDAGEEWDQAEAADDAEEESEQDEEDAEDDAGDEDDEEWEGEGSDDEDDEDEEDEDEEDWEDEDSDEDEAGDEEEDEGEEEEEEEEEESDDDGEEDDSEDDDEDWEEDEEDDGEWEDEDADEAEEPTGRSRASGPGRASTPGLFE